MLEMDEEPAALLSDLPRGGRRRVGVYGKVLRSRRRRVGVYCNTIVFEMNVRTPRYLIWISCAHRRWSRIRSAMLPRPTT